MYEFQKEHGNWEELSCHNASDTLCNKVMHDSQTQTALTALQALQEALKYVQKSQKSSKQAVTESLTGRIAAITAFLQAQQLFGSDAASAVQMCNGLIVEVRWGLIISAPGGRCICCGLALTTCWSMLQLQNSRSAEPWFTDTCTIAAALLPSIQSHAVHWVICKHLVNTIAL